MNQSLPEGYKQVPDNSRYATSRQGNVWDIVLKRIVYGSKFPSGYLGLSYRENGKSVNFKVHRLVASTWVEVPERLLGSKARLIIKHKDNDRSNNAASNLEWTTTSEVYEQELKDIDATLPAGFRLVPGLPMYAASEAGDLYNVKLGRLAAVNTVPSGYVLTSFAEGGRTRTFRVHRLIAMTWIPIPEHLQNAEVLPDINHKDGNKANNATYNLEWCTDKENQQHAVETGLMGHRRVKAKNLLTNEEFSFSSAHDASRHFGVRAKKLIGVLDSEYAGKITKDYWVFLYEDQEWPELSADLIIQDRWDKLKGLWVAVKDGVRVVGSTLEIVCNAISVTYTSVQPMVRADGESHIVQGIEFYYSNFPTKDLIDSAIYSEAKPVFRKQRKITITFFEPIKTTAVYDSVRSLSIALNMDASVIAYAIMRKGGFHNGMHFAYVD